MSTQVIKSVYPEGDRELKVLLTKLKKDRDLNSSTTYPIKLSVNKVIWVKLKPSSSTSKVGIGGMDWDCNAILARAMNSNASTTHRLVKNENAGSQRSGTRIRRSGRNGCVWFSGRGYEKTLFRCHLQIYCGQNEPREATMVTCTLLLFEILQKCI